MDDSIQTFNDVKASTACKCSLTKQTNANKTTLTQKTHVSYCVAIAALTVYGPVSSMTPQPPEEQQLPHKVRAEHNVLLISAKL